MLSVLQSINKGVQYIVDYLSNGLKYKHFIPDIMRSIHDTLDNVAPVIPIQFLQVLLFAFGLNMIRKVFRW